MAVPQKKEANNTFVWLCNKDPFANFNASSPYTIQCAEEHLHHTVPSTTSNGDLGVLG
jgi:hypothetical protein